MLSHQIRELARQAGIDVVRITHAGSFEGYLWPDSPRRDPRLTLPGARSLLVFGIYIGGFHLPGWDDPTVGRTSRLILSSFDLDIVEPLEPIVSFLGDRGFAAVPSDSLQPGGAILPLKLAAVRAGLGWQGKNSLLITRQYGSFLALGGIVTDAPLGYDAGSEEDRCRGCHACRDACPTGALDEPYRLRLDRCLSFLLQEEGLPAEARPVTGNRVLQCEICQRVCPWNRKHLRQPLDTPRTRRFQARVDELTSLFRLSRLFRLSEGEYEEFLLAYRTNIPYKLFRRNVVLALGHSPQPDALPLLELASTEEDSEIREIAQASLASLRSSTM